MPAQEPDGATTKSKGAKASIACLAMSRLVARSPELKAGWPQQLCGGTCTLQPASSRSFTAAKPTDGRIRSTRQVTNSPTCLVARSVIVQLPDSSWPPQTIKQKDSSRKRGAGAQSRHAKRSRPARAERERGKPAKFQEPAAHIGGVRPSLPPFSAP